MLKKKRLGSKVVVLVLTVVLATVAFAQVSKTLRYKGAIVSEDIHIFNGRPYVPLADVAKLLGGTAVKTGTEYEIRPVEIDAATPDAPGGANQVEGRRGKIGETLFDGRWRFQVLDVKRAESYAERFDTDPQTFQPKGTGDTLVIVHCQVKNGLKQNQNLGFFPQYAHTALADDEGNAYPPMAADIRSAEHLRGLVTEEMLPGSKMEFSLVFSVPRDAKLKDLIFTLTNSIGAPKSDVRVTMMH